ncbi:hypothetical protein [Spirosoma flavum]|uniref:DUF4369 domain-containing protein n=1 Tax=Spirosoma flavum TaxID=2048557 RepID=A0ABW6AME9_9BACT
MKYGILLLCLSAYHIHAQSRVSGLGEYMIGVTTPDSLKGIDFKEEGQAYVKGTLTLPCTHIRIFKASKVEIKGVFVANFSLFFYDNLLFKLSCDYSDELKKSFVLNYGEGVPSLQSSIPICTKEKGKPMLIWSETWRNNGVLAIVVHAKGYNDDCVMEQITRLSIASQQVSALTSDCELIDSHSFVEEFANLLNGR